LPCIVGGHHPLLSVISGRHPSLSVINGHCPPLSIIGGRHPPLSVIGGRCPPLSICYNPEPSPQFSAIFHHFISRSLSLVLHSFPHAPLGPLPNHLTSHLIDHLTNLQSTITCHHSAVRSTPQYHHLTPFGLPTHDAPLRSCQLMMELYLELPRHDLP